MTLKKSTYLKSTNQLVTVLNWTGQGSKPWPSDYTQIFRSFVGCEGKKSEVEGEVMVVRDDSLIHRKYEG
jgi:hypothetical protein